MALRNSRALLRAARRALVDVEAPAVAEAPRHGAALACGSGIIDALLFPDRSVSVLHPHQRLISLAVFQSCASATWQAPQLRTAFGSALPADRKESEQLPPRPSSRYEWRCLHTAPGPSTDSACSQTENSSPAPCGGSGGAEKPRAAAGGAARRSSADPESSGPSPTELSSGWTRQEVWNAPNAISLARLASGPVIASWIVAGDTSAALIGLTISGWSDWLDGYVARRLNQQSVLGSYLDPLADKVLICSVVAALGLQGTLPGYLAALIIGRDVFLVGASFAARARELGWRGVSPSEFFRISQPGASQVSSGNAVGVPGAGSVTPLYVSKINTVFQLATVSGYLLHACTGWPPVAVLDAAAILTASTTVVSGAAYVKKFWRR